MSVGRREFSLGLGCTAAMTALGALPRVAGTHSFDLRFLDGVHTVTLVTAGALESVASAQYYMDPNWQAYYAQLQWQQYQQAMAVQQQYLLSLAQQYSWLQQQRIGRFDHVARRYSSYQHSEPTVMDAVQSVYGFAQKLGLDKLVMYGLNRFGGPVVTKYVVPAFAGLWNGLKMYYHWSQDALEKNLAPQQNERNGALVLRDGSEIPAVAYRTASGAVALSKGPVLVDGDYRRVGKLRDENGDEHFLRV